MSSIEIGKNGFKYHADGLNDPITKIKRKKRFRSIYRMFRWFKVRKIDPPTEIFLCFDRYWEFVYSHEVVILKNEFKILPEKIS